MTNRTRTQEEEILNHLLVSIVIANSGTIISNDKISLLESWLAVLNNGPVVEYGFNVWQSFNNWG
jgi:hypothetical protein